MQHPPPAAAAASHPPLAASRPRRVPVVAEEHACDPHACCQASQPWNGAQPFMPAAEERRLNEQLAGGAVLVESAPAPACRRAGPAKLLADTQTMAQKPAQRRGQVFVGRQAAAPTERAGSLRRPILGRRLVWLDEFCQCTAAPPVLQAAARWGVAKPLPVRLCLLASDRGFARALFAQCLVDVSHPPYWSAFKASSLAANRERSRGCSRSSGRATASQWLHHMLILQR